jgi:hypothetical protein
MFLVLILLEPSKPQGLEWQEILGKFKKITSWGIEAAAFWFVAQCLNHYAAACPILLQMYDRKYFSK